MEIQKMLVAWIVLIFPAALMVAGAIRLREKAAPIMPPEWAERAALIGIALAAYSAFHAITFGPTTSPVLGLGQIGFSVRLDAVSVILLMLMSILAWIILRFSATHLQAEEGEGRFTFWVCFTLAGIVLLFVTGNLVQLGFGWIVTSTGVNRLVNFYPHRLGAHRHTRKKIIFTRVTNIALAAGLLLLYAAYGGSDIASINTAARAGVVPTTAILAAACLATAAVFQSALLPVHGWLTETTQAPTPASALLHTGVLSAGGFLLIRFADVMLGAPLILAVLVVVGGFSALVGSVVMLTQSAAKTALVWSTISQMGFVVLLCGLGLFPFALLHIVAHAFYKTHAFLSAAKANHFIRAARKVGPVAAPSTRNVVQAMGIAITIYAFVALPLGLLETSPQAVAIGAVLVLGVGYLGAQGRANAAPRSLRLATAKASVLFAASYFGLQWIAQKLTAGTLPPTPRAGPLEWMVIAWVLISFAAVAILQTLLPLWSTHPVVRKLRVHVANGLYLDARMDLFAGAWKTDPLKKDT
ncbi:MAG: NAD(P)H-quinone oxidoreductase subunit 5 [Yoonia sp.]|jgi:NAD(P)H-quinone oxidoreductase subunit 5